MMYTPTGFDRQWAYCEKALVATEQSVGAGGGAWDQSRRMALLVGLDLVPLMGAILFVARRPSDGADDGCPQTYCAKCLQKIRFHVNQAASRPCVGSASTPFAIRKRTRVDRGNGTDHPVGRHMVAGTEAVDEMKRGTR